jgi:hypothetical protein
MTQGGLNSNGQTDAFLHEAKTRTACGGHRLGPPPGGTHDGNQRSNFIFELHAEPVDQRQTPGEGLQDLGGRRDRIAAVEAATRQDGRFRACLVSQHYLDTTFFHGFPSFLSKRGSHKSRTNRPFVHLDFPPHVFMQNPSVLIPRSDP